MARRTKDEDQAPDTTPDSQPPREDPDQAVLRGGPGQEPAAEPAPPREAAQPDQPSRTRVKLGRGEFEVEADLARAIEERERDYMRGIQLDRRDRDELDRYRRASQPTQPSTEPDWNTLLFENPAKALELRDRAIEERLERRYTQARTADQIWAKFYEDHADLADERFLVASVYRRDYDALQELPTGQALEIIADTARKEILRISRKSKGSGGPATPLPTGRATVEGATGDRSAPPARRAEEDDDKPWSLSQELKQRRASRRKSSA